jgi:hypothetical protein
MVLQCRLKADVGGPFQAIGDKKGMRRDLLMGFGESIEAAAKLNELSGLDPSGKLSPKVNRVHFPGQQ